MSRCKHTELEYKETIQASTSIFISYNNELGEVLNCNNEYGNRIKEEVFCMECDKKWSVNKNSPKFVKDFLVKINKLKNL